MRLVFLDFDGVLAPFKKVGEYKQILQDIVGDMGCIEFEPEAVKQINEICKEGRASIVVSSSWRYYLQQDDIMQRMLHAQGVFAPYLGMTPSWNTSYQSRGEEIQGYMVGRTVESFVILDDADFRWEELTPYWVRSPAWTGLTEKETKKALKILQKGS